MNRVFLFLAVLLLEPSSVLRAAVPVSPKVDLRENLAPSPVKDVSLGSATIRGKADVPDDQALHVRVTTSLGGSFESRVKANAKRSDCRFPQDFPGAPPLSPMLLYVDATDADEFGGKDMLVHQAEMLLVVSGKGRDALPDLPLVFTDDFIDAQQIGLLRLLGQEKLTARQSRLTFPWLDKLTGNMKLLRQPEEECAGAGGFSSRAVFVH